MSQIRTGIGRAGDLRVRARITPEGWARCQGTHPKGGVCDRVLARVEGPASGVSIKCPRCGAVNEIACAGQAG